MAAKNRQELSLTLIVTHKLIALFLVIFLVFSGSVLAQTRVTNNFALITENFCWMKECKAKERSFPLQIPDLWNEADEALVKQNSNPHSGFSLKDNSATEGDADIRFLNHIAQTTDGQVSALIKQFDESEHFSSRYDLFRNEDKGIGDKLLRASFMTQTAQITNLIVMIAFPDSFNNSCRSWPEAKRNLHRAWTTAPVWDKDPWRTNFVAHPYIGGFYYNALHSQGVSGSGSFLYSTGQSLIWEFVIEAAAEQPSIQDLLFTSTLGSFIGEMSHRATIRMGRNGFSTFEKILTAIINPAYVFNNGYKKHHRAPASLFK